MAPLIRVLAVRSDSLESVIIPRCSQYRRIRGERQSRQAGAFRSKLYDQFRGQMTSCAEEIRRQLEESARVKQSFSDELIIVA